MPNQAVCRLLPIALCLLLLGGCGGGGGDGNAPGPQPSVPVFAHDGLEGRTIKRLYQHQSQLYAATDNGLFGKPLGQSGWQALGLVGRNLADIVFINDQHWLAATFASGANPFLDPKIFETVNGGSNWEEVTNNFGGQAPQSEGVFALYYDAAGGQLFATGANALARSTDNGRDWELLDGTWDSLSSPLDALRLNAATNQVWYGGQNSIEEMTLRRHDLATGQTESYVRLLPSPSTIKGITLDPNNANRVIASGEGGILLTVNNGSSWIVILRNEDSRFYFQTALDPQNSQVIYTAGWDKIFDEPQPLIFEFSTNGGSSWEMHEFADPLLFGGVWSVLAAIENGRTVVYLGLYRGGVMKVSFSSS